MLKLDHITKYYDDFLAVDDISFEIKEGEIFGLLGVNGAGKTTTFRMIVGLLEKTKGEITLFNKKIDYNQTDKIGFLTEERSLLPSKTVYEQAIFYGTLKGMKESKIEKKLDEYLKLFKIEEYKHRKIKELSKKKKKKVQFITSVIHSPKLLILDEPFSGLDPINVEMFETPPAVLGVYLSYGFGTQNVVLIEVVSPTGKCCVAITAKLLVLASSSTLVNHVD